MNWKNSVDVGVIVQVVIQNLAQMMFAYIGNGLICLMRKMKFVGADVALERLRVQMADWICCGDHVCFYLLLYEFSGSL